MSRPGARRNPNWARLALIWLATMTLDAAAAERSGAGAIGKQQAQFGYLRIDRYWYGITSNRFWDLDASIGRMIAEDTTVRICRRNDGSAPTLGATTIDFGMPANRLTADRIGVQLGTTRIISIDTIDGDIHCAGQVPEPALYGDAFE